MKRLSSIVVLLLSSRVSFSVSIFRFSARCKEQICLVFSLSLSLFYLFRLPFSFLFPFTPPLSSRLRKHLQTVMFAVRRRCYQTRNTNKMPGCDAICTIKRRQNPELASVSDSSATAPATTTTSRHVTTLEAALRVKRLRDPLDDQLAMVERYLPLCRIITQVVLVPKSFLSIRPSQSLVRTINETSSNCRSFGSCCFLPLCSYLIVPI